MRPLAWADRRDGVVELFRLAYFDRVHFHAEHRGGFFRFAQSKGAGRGVRIP
ncbi:MAG TPA: hypothetical protein VFB92_00640 [Vicinamibacterales bacterium]|nr:hypothetical protein [Vicinamibacterales bacterium]